MKTKYNILLLFGLLFLDQLSKYLVLSNLALHEKIVVIEDFFSIFYVRNDGAAFSMLEGKLWLFYIITIAGLIVVYKIYQDSKSNFLKTICFILLAGILGNFIDRIIHQEVIDFLSFNIFGYNFAIFNFADVYICVALFMFVVDVLFLERGRENEKNND